MGDPVKPSEAVLPKALRDGLAAVGDGVEVDVPDPWMETEEQARERRQQQARLKRARWEERLPLDYVEASVDDFDPQVAARAAQALHDPQVRNIVLVGSPGVGKTHLAFALGRIAVAEGAWVEAWSLHDLMLASLPSAPDPGLMEKRAKGCAVFLLDDLGAGRTSDFAVDHLTSIIDARVANRRTTIVTTNSSEPVLRSVWGDRLMDRLRHGLVAIELEGRSRRGPAW